MDDVIEAPDPQLYDWDGGRGMGWHQLHDAIGRLQRIGAYPDAAAVRAEMTPCAVTHSQIEAINDSYN